MSVGMCHHLVGLLCTWQTTEDWDALTLCFCRDKVTAAARGSGNEMWSFDQHLSNYVEVPLMEFSRCPSDTDKLLRRPRQYHLTLAANKIDTK